MTLKENLIGLKELPGKFESKGEILSMKAKLTERKTLLSRRTLFYSCNVRIDEKGKKVDFSDALEQKGIGFLDNDEDSAGLGLKREVYKLSGKDREGKIEEVSKLFGKDYSYSFDYSKVREAVKKECQKTGYKFNLSLFG